MSKQQWTPPPESAVLVQDKDTWEPPADKVVEVKKKASTPALPNGSNSSVIGSKPSQVSPQSIELSNQLANIAKGYQQHLTPKEREDYQKSVESIRTNPDRVRATTKEEQDAQHAMDSTMGKVGKSLTYLGSKASKGAVQIAKGGAWIFNHLNTGLADTETKGQKEFWDKVDKFTDLGLTKGQQAHIEGSKGVLPGLVQTGGMMAEIAPALAGGEYTQLPKTFFALQGLGQGKETIDNVDPDKKLHSLVRDAFVLGSGAVNGLLMGDLGENVFGKMPAGLRKNIVTDIVANAMKEGAGKELTDEGFKKLLNNGAKDFAQKFQRFGISALEKYNKSVVDLSALNAANFALKKGVDATTDKPVFNESTGDLAHSIEDIATKQAPLFAAIGAIPEATKLLPYSNFKNDIVEHVMANPNDAENIKAKMADLGQKMGWTSEEIQATNAHVDQIADAAKKLPENIKPEKRADGVQLLLDRDKLQGELTKEESKREGFDESVKDIPSKQEEYLTDKIDQANDKLRSLVTGKPTTYSKGVGDEEGKFFKTTDGKKEEITENRYNLENLERTTKQQQNGKDENAQKGDEESSQEGQQGGEKGQVSQEESGQEGNVLTQGAENAPTFTKEGNQSHAIEKISEQEGGVGEHTPGDEGRKTTETGSGNRLVGTTEGEGKEKPRFKIKGEIVTRLTPEEHTEANELLAEHGITTKDIEDEQQERNASSQATEAAIPDEKGVQQPADDGAGNAGKTTAGEKAQGEEGKTEPSAVRVENDKEGRSVKKTILTQRAYEGEIQPEVKKHLEEKGLTRKSFSQEERSKQATELINKFGHDASFQAIKAGDIDGGLAASILAQLQIKNSREMSEFPEGAERDALAKKQADLIELMEQKGYLGGEFNGQLAHEYENAELNYANVKKQVEKLTDKPLTKEQEQKIKDITSENEKLKKQLDEAESKLIDETDKAFKSGQEAAKNETKAEKAKRIADKIRAGKINNRPSIFSAATPASLVWDTAIEVTAKAVETGGKLADAIDAGIKHIKESDWYKGLSDGKKTQAEKEFERYHHENSGSTDLEDLQARFVDKKDNNFTASQARDIWNYIKTAYLDNGTSYRDAVAKTANDLGLSWRQVSEAIITPKTKRISDDMWKRQADYTRNRIAIKNWIGDQNKSAAGKLLQKVSGLFRGVAVFGHGGIFIGTHAGMTLFQPTTWNKTIPAFFRGWKFAYGNEANYERSIEELKNSKNYVLAQRAGLKNNPERINTEEYQKSQKYLGRLGLAGEKGFNAIKVLRQDLFDYHFNKLSAAERDDPAVAKSIAHLVNLATGATNVNIPSWVNEASFAGGMEAARWEKLTASPIKATNTALKAIFTPSKASPAERVFAKVWAKRVGQQLGTYSALLLANASIQNQLNPKNPVNMTNPNAPDFLKFKFGDKAIDATSGMRSTAMFMRELGKIPFESKKELHGDKRVAVAGKDIAGYARGKLSPLYGTGADFFSGQDFSGNVMPYSKDKPGKGKHKLDWLEYGSSKLPLPVAEAFNVYYKSALESGAKKSTLDDVIDGIMSGAISGTTGFRVSEYGEKDAKKNKMKKP